MAMKRKEINYQCDLVHFLKHPCECSTCSHSAITDLSIVNSKLEGLSLKHLTGLQKLELKYTKMGNDLRISSTLKTLRLFACKMSFFKDTFENLESLSIEDMTFGQHLIYDNPTIKTLSLWSSTDIGKYDLEEAIAMLPNLESLKIYDDRLYKPHHLEKCAKLKHLELSDVTLKDISFIKNLDLLSFSSWSCGIKDLSALDGMHNLESLTLYGGPEDLAKNNDGLSFIKNKKHLKHLVLHGYKPLDMSMLEGLESLERLEITDCGLTNASAVTKLPNLKILNLSSNMLYKVPYLGGMKLDKLNLSWNCLMEIPLMGNTELIIKGNYCNATSKEITYSAYRGRCRLDIANCDNRVMKPVYETVVRYLINTYPSSTEHDLSGLSEVSLKNLRKQLGSHYFTTMFNVVWTMIMNHENKDMIISEYDEELAKSKGYYCVEYAKLVIIVTKHYGIPLPINCRSIFDKIMCDNSKVLNKMNEEERYSYLKPLFDKAYADYEYAIAFYA